MKLNGNPIVVCSCVPAYGYPLCMEVWLPDHSGGLPQRKLWWVEGIEGGGSPDGRQVRAGKCPKCSRLFRVLEGEPQSAAAPITQGVTPIMPEATPVPADALLLQGPVVTVIITVATPDDVTRTTQANRDRQKHRPRLEADGCAHVTIRRKKMRRNPPEHYSRGQANEQGVLTRQRQVDPPRPEALEAGFPVTLPMLFGPRGTARLDLYTAERIRFARLFCTYWHSGLPRHVCPDWSPGDDDAAFARASEQLETLLSQRQSL